MGVREPRRLRTPQPSARHASADAGVPRGIGAPDRGAGNAADPSDRDAESEQVELDMSMNAIHDTLPLGDTRTAAQNLVAIVTGAGDGIGWATSERLSGLAYGQTKLLRGKAPKRAGEAEEKRSEETAKTGQCSPA